MCVCSVVSKTLCNPQPARLLCLWNFPGQNTGVGCRFLLQGIFPSQRLNPCHLCCRQVLYLLNHPGEFSGDPVVRTPSFHSMGPGSIPGGGNKILKAAWHSQKTIKRKKHVCDGCRIKKLCTLTLEF